MGVHSNFVEIVRALAEAVLDHSALTKAHGVSSSGEHLETAVQTG